MTKKLLIAVAASFLVALVIAGQIVAWRAEERLDGALRLKLQQSGFPLPYDYSDIDIALTLRSMSLRDVELTDPEGGQITCDRVTVSVPFSNIPEFFWSEDLEDLQLSGVSLENLTVTSPDEEITIKLGHLDFDLETPFPVRLRCGLRKIMVIRSCRCFGSARGSSCGSKVWKCNSPNLQYHGE